MSHARLVLIAAPELIPALRERVGDDSLEAFADSEPLRALDAINRQRPAVIALERLFAASPRGAALIARIKADTALNESEIHVLSHDSDYKRISPRRNSGGAVADRAPRTVERPLLDKGTRRAPRYRIEDGAPVFCEGQPARLIDLSETGAQLASSVTLRLKQEVAVALGPADTCATLTGIIVWAREDPSDSGPIYRVGVDFTNPDRKAVAAFCQTRGRL